MPFSDIQIITNAFIKFGGTIFQQNLLQWALAGDGIQFRTNVNQPQAMTKLSANGAPQPYRAQEDFDGNGAKFTDRVLTAYQSKWDWMFDNEEFRNTYLADKALQEKGLYTAALNFLIDKYKEYLKTNSFYNGVRAPNGTTPVDIADGWGTIIANEITGGKITPIVTGAIDVTNAVAKTEAFIEDGSIPAWMNELGGLIYCSYQHLAKYTKNYRVVNGYQFKPNEFGQYQLDNKKFYLKAVSWMGTSARLIATIPNNLVMGTDVDQVAVYPTPNLNLIKTRLMMPVGFQIQDLEALYVNDQA